MWTGANTNAEEVYNNNMANLGKAPVAAAPTGAPKEEAKQPAAPVKKAAPAKPAKKAASKVCRGKLVDFSDYVNETIILKADEVEMGHMFNFYNCEKTKVVIEGKAKSVLVSRGKRMDLSVTELISGIEVIKSEATKLRV